MSRNARSRTRTLMPRTAPCACGFSLTRKGRLRSAELADHIVPDAIRLGHRWPQRPGLACDTHRLVMTSFERTSLVAAFAGVLVTLVAFVVELGLLRRQVAQATTSTKLDHERRRKQATIEFYETTLNKRTELRAHLPYDRDAQAVAGLLASVSHEDDDAGKAITEYLSLFELLAAGVRSGVFDHDVIQRIAGSRIRAIATNYRPWIEARRQLYSNPALYQEIEWLAQSFEPTPTRRR